MNKKGRKILVTGTFDILHQGHLNLFKQAKALGNILIVIVARDKTVERVKNRLPKNSEKKRLMQVQETKIVDQAILGNLDDPYRIVVELHPDIVALGYDQSTFTDELSLKLKKRGLETRIVRLKPYYPEKYKSSKMNL